MKRSELNRYISEAKDLFEKYKFKLPAWAYFTPQEWWSLGPDGIIWEIQQAYKNFIAALDPYLINQSELNRPVAYKKKRRHDPKPDHSLMEILATEKASTTPVLV